MRLRCRLRLLVCVFLPLRRCRRLLEFSSRLGERFLLFLFCFLVLLCSRGSHLRVLLHGFLCTLRTKCQLQVCLFNPALSALNVTNESAREPSTERLALLHGARECVTEVV